MTADIKQTRKVDVSTARHGLLLVFIAALVYSVIHVGFRLLASDVLGEDDIIDNILVQDLRLGYDAFPRQPPLYDWLLWLVQRVTGPGIVGFLLIKYSALVATACLLYLAALRVLKDRLFAILTVESLALIYQISWRFHEGFTHEVGAMVAVVATAWLFLRLINYSRPVDFVVLGISVGLGLLTEPAFAVFFVSLLAAGAMQRSVRARFLKPMLSVTLLIACAIAMPYVWWVAAEPHRIKALFRPTIDHLGDALLGLSDALRGPIFYLSPLLFILPLVFPSFIFTAWTDLKRGPSQKPQPDLAQLFLHAALIALLVSVVGALAFAIKDLAVHVLMPLYLTSVIWLFSVAKRSVSTPLSVRRFTNLAVAIAIIALLARLANMFILDPVCNTCRWGIPYQALGAKMREHGFENGDTIISIDHELAGNLRAIFPGSNIVARRYPRFFPKNVKLRSGTVAFVWGTQLSDEEVEKYLKSFMPPGRSLKEAANVHVPWHHIYKPEGYRLSNWKLLIIDMDRASWPKPKN